MRKIPAKEPDTELYNNIKNIIQEQEEEVKQNKVDLFYYDESGFSLNSNIPYAWHKKGADLTIKNSRSKNLTVSGFLATNGKLLYPYISNHSMDSETLIAIFDDFVSKLTKKSFVVIDNAPTHKSKIFKNNISRWEEKGLYIIYLPPYSPQLNKIEILWRLIKYNWMPIEAYNSIEDLNYHLDRILATFGKEYTINFKSRINQPSSL